MSKNISYSEQEIAELFSKACDLHQRKNHTEAENLYRLLIEKYPEAWLLRYNLGLLFFEQHRLDEALAEYQKAVSLTSSSNDLFFNLAICQKALGLYEDAVQSYKRALEINPEDIDVYYNCAGCYAILGKDEKASECYQEVLKRDPAHQHALVNLAYLCHKTGKKQQAIKLYSSLLTLNPGHKAADHMRAALQGTRRSSAPDSYIKEVFDHYSDHYEDSLINRLHYSLPQQLFSFVERTSAGITMRSTLDLGCGTGLTGQRFRTLSATLHGVDLSEKMLQIAHRKNIYDALFTSEIGKFLSECRPDTYDFLIAADVFSYVGGIENVFVKAHRASRDGAFFFFSVEDLQDDICALQLKESGRFAHSATYIRETAQKVGWQIMATEIVDLRRERDSWIKGALYGMIKS